MRSLPGLRSTGFIAASGTTRAAWACSHWARPISMALDLDESRLTFHVLEAPDPATASRRISDRT